jgi:hypothetical protein
MKTAMQQAQMNLLDAFEAIEGIQFKEHKVGCKTCKMEMAFVSPYHAKGFICNHPEHKTYLKVKVQEMK